MIPLRDFISQLAVAASEAARNVKDHHTGRYFDAHVVGEDGEVNARQVKIGNQVMDVPTALMEGTDTVRVKRVKYSTEIDIRQGDDGQLETSVSRGGWRSPVLTVEVEIESDDSAAGVASLHHAHLTTFRQNFTTPKRVTGEDNG